eukprot:COSAG06_NODE_49062_length_328_cov_0.454148_1_plen_20_part_10
MGGARVRNFFVAEPQMFSSH